MRRLDVPQIRFISRLTGLIGALTGVAAIVIVATGYPVRSPGGVGGVGAVWLAFGPLLVLLSILPSDELLLRTHALFMYTAIIVATTSITFAALFAGPDIGLMVLAAHVLPGIVAVYVFPRRLAVVVFAAVISGMAAVVFLQEGWFFPVGTVLIGAAYFIGSALLISGIVDRHDDAARAERKAKAALAELNATLQQRVDEQVDELGRLGQLRRFLSPQLADVVMSAGSEDVLKPHRKEIAVFFCDLRSYTRFTVSEAPEDVLTALDEYYAAVCAIIQRHNATIGNFTGDGLMAFLNDPLDHPDLAGGAISIALELRDEMGPLIDRWAKRGFTLGYGVGIAVGYATLGLLGNDQRSDYTAVGPVVNLESRLCADASSGQILVDHRTRSAIEGWVRTEQLEPVTLKGFPEPVPAYNVIGTGSVTAV